MSIGRRKFIKPLYEELVKTPAGRARALAIYREGAAGVPSHCGGHGGPHRGMAGMSVGAAPGARHVESAARSTARTPAAST